MQKQWIYALLAAFLSACAAENNSYNHTEELRDTTENQVQSEIIYTSSAHENIDSCIRARYRYDLSNNDTSLIRRELRLYQLSWEEAQFFSKEERLLRNFRVDKHNISDTSYYWAETDANNLRPQEYTLALEDAEQKIDFRFEVRQAQKLSPQQIDSLATIIRTEIDTQLSSQQGDESYIWELQDTGDSNYIVLFGKSKKMALDIEYKLFIKAEE